MNPAATLTPLNDFSDRLSPMVVKELRQGLRARGFGALLLGTHLLLIIITLMTGSASNAEEIRWMLDGLATLALCILLPLRGFSALADEVRLNTLDMLVLTRLSAGRIVFGKWASISAQTLLIAVSLMPYIVARYVFGGSDLFSELTVLGLKWLLGSVIAAAIVAVSAVKQPWLRSLVIGVPLFFSTFGIFGLFMALSFGGSSRMSVSGPTLSNLMLLLIFAGAVWAVFAFLSIAATRIAPAASRLSLIKRPIHTITLLALVLSGIFSDQVGFLAAAAFVAGIASIDALTEPLNSIPSVYVPLYRRGPLGALLTPLLAPGWASGFALSFILGLCVIAGIWVVEGLEDATLSGIGACALWMVGTLVCVFSKGRSQDMLGLFVGMTLLVYLLSAMLGLISYGALGSDDLPWLLCLLPTTAIPGISSVSGDSKNTFLVLSCLFAGLWPLILGSLSLVAWRQLSPAREQARRMAA